MPVGYLPEDPERFKKYLAEHNPPCPECGYSLEGLSVRVCPECGQSLSVAAFMRAKRKKSDPPPFLHVFTTAAAFCVFALLLSCLIPVQSWLAFAMMGVVVAYLITFGVWYWWADR